MRRFERAIRLFPQNAALARPLIVTKFGTDFWTDLTGSLESWAKLKTSVHEAFVEALEEGDLTRDLNPGFVEGQMYVGFQSALDRWAFALIDDESFVELSLSAAYLTLLAVASPNARPPLEKKLRKLERSLKKRPAYDLRLPASAYSKKSR